jgi:hypothetical protein
MKKHIRNLYEKYGVKEYYEKYNEDYENLHLLEIKELILKNKDKFNLKKVLDLCSGRGEVTKILQELNIRNICGLDPYFKEIYEKETNKECFKLSFDDILKGKLDDNYSCIICSFAYHLIPKNDIYILTKELFLHTKQLVIISPTKKDELKKYGEFKLILEDYSLTKRGKKVYLKMYVI